MTSALTVYAGALHRAARGGDGALRLVDPTGTLLWHVDTAAWQRDPTAGDSALLARCTGPTLDIGCGPGRLTAALTRRGVPALGIDVSAAAVRLAQARGADAVVQDVFAPLPGGRSWRHALLADGNIGIGGDPARLLSRCRDLLAPGGTVIAEVEAPGTRGWRGRVAITDDRRTSDPFAWAVVSADDLTSLAEHAGLRVAETWTEENRWFACLSR
ncbi:methyltransferase domain-containing protein [Catellatospora citrea]|uniref:Methyltransferase type 12 n=1 Tax=Catellatospora citrea TaxID=53366 RepID=A0A8J3KFZ0_9ACTN|nr:class I SAM-dependent methyltransferase [Catellatospora citrea]RKE10469.1 methyltransferase family protein [Catellatospora citrea]GIF99022.1 methyltransferase type 12 [Catellatospora citrea]